METRNIKIEEFESISNLLKANTLPYEDLLSSKVVFATRKINGKAIACIGIEKYGENALLRSFAVDNSYKNKGIGTELLLELVKKCQNEGIKTLHLLTTTADKYFEKNGFLVADRTSAPLAITRSKEFSVLCPASSVYMKKVLIE